MKIFSIENSGITIEPYSSKKSDFVLAVDSQNQTKVRICFENTVLVLWHSKRTASKIFEVQMLGLDSPFVELIPESFIGDFFSNEKKFFQSQQNYKEFIILCDSVLITETYLGWQKN